jgi:hypothetical protein
MRSVRPALILTMLIVGACTIDDLQHENRFCSVDNPCAEGFDCQQGKCVARGQTPDGPPPKTDGQTDTGADRGPAADLSGDAPAADLLRVPDAGCPAGLSLCGGACVDTQISFDHCGGCDQPCEPGVSDRCEDGLCHCGHLQPLCLDGLTCYKGTCTCVTGPSSMCDGCCLNDKCQTGTAASACGLGGVACTVCPSDACKTPTCVSGTCGAILLKNGTACVTASKQGKCYTGNCCTGCWSTTKNVCYSGTSNTYCGNYGNNCATCIAPATCMTATQTCGSP